MKKLRVAQALTIGTLALLYLFSIEPVAEGLISPLENRHPPLLRDVQVPADFIVILGAATVEHSPEYGGETVLAPDSLRRVDYAIGLHNRLGTPMIFSGGSGNKPNPGKPEAETASAYCVSRGLDPAVLNVEPRSRNTDENASETKRLFAPETVILVTSAYHMPRSVLIFRQHGMNPIPAPTDYKAGRAGFGFLSFLPHQYNLYVSSVAVKEYVGLIFYRIVGIFRR
jgi:uncharacterized SAM-binding protein YcdF (DUF218 family)